MLSNTINTMRPSTRSVANRSAVLVRAAPVAVLSRHDLEQKRRAEAKARQDAEDEARRKRLVAANMANSSSFPAAPKDSKLATA
jgi:hypothetical protein